MKNFPFILMLVAFLICQFTIFGQKKTRANLLETSVDATEGLTICTSTLNETYTTLVSCSDTLVLAKERMVHAYLKGADDYWKCSDITIHDSTACARIKEALKKLGVEND